jgi:hypothetical protein
MLPNVGGNWDNTANAGVFGVGLSDIFSYSRFSRGARAVRLLAA